MFVLLHVGAQVFVVVGLHSLLIAGVEFGVGLGFEDVGETVFAPVLGVFGIGQDGTQRLLARLAGIAGDGFEFQILDSPCHPEEEIRNKRTR